MLNINERIKGLLNLNNRIAKTPFLAQKLKITKRTHLGPGTPERENIDIDSKTGFPIRSSG